MESVSAPGCVSRSTISAALSAGNSVGLIVDSHSAYAASTGSAAEPRPGSQPPSATSGAAASAAASMPFNSNSTETRLRVGRWSRGWRRASSATYGADVGDTTSPAADTSTRSAAPAAAHGSRPEWTTTNSDRSRRSASRVPARRIRSHAMPTVCSDRRAMPVSTVDWNSRNTTSERPLPSR